MAQPQPARARSQRHEASARLRDKQRKAEEKSANRAHVRRKKNMPGTVETLHLIAPDETWAPVPFADATVSPKELPAAKRRAVQAMFEWGVLVEASRASGIGRYVLTRLIKSDATFRLQMAGAKHNCMERVEREMIRRGMLPRGELAAIYITKHNILKYREIQRVELTGKNGAPVAYIDAKAELLRRLEAIAVRVKATAEPEALVIGGKPQLMKGGSPHVEIGTIRKTDGRGFKAESRK